MGQGMIGTMRSHPKAIGGGLRLVVALVLWLGLPMAAAGQAADGGLRGEFAVTIAPEDVPRDLLGGPALVGRWEIAFKADGTYVLGRQDVGAVASGRYGVDGDLVTLTDEAGLLACGVGIDGRAAVGVYGWEMTGERLGLAAVQDACAGRRLLLTTRTLSAFVACPVPVAAGAALEASTPPPAGIDAGSPLDFPRPPVTAAAAIDDLLTRMSACWATTEPGRFLPLLSSGFRDSLISDGDDDLERFAIAMGASLVWDRVGGVETVDASHVVATIRQTSGDHEDFARYAFVYEDGAWRWDGTASA